MILPLIVLSTMFFTENGCLFVCVLMLNVIDQILIVESFLPCISNFNGIPYDAIVKTISTCNRLQPVANCYLIKTTYSTECALGIECAI